ncbi:MAG: type I methionyl aminopeptidase [Puniceicoccales bacterium]|jgi:methionyl aminopeptidase|nr:type I methionyl aminopeptidase [Puniceicoccales bacterium]
MIPIKTAAEIAIMREVCLAAAIVLSRMVPLVRAGVTTQELDVAGRDFMKELGVESGSYNYKHGRLRFPAHTCISVNDEVVHGVPSPCRAIQPGDVVSLDVVVRKKGFSGDNACTVLVEPVSTEVRALCETTREALYAAIDQARAGNRVHDISHAVQRHVRFANYGIVEEYVGHGIGRDLHEAPQIPNFGKPGTGALLRPGMTLAVEPMITLGAADIVLAADGWTVRTKDGKPAAHYEHTILITEGPPEILTVTG